MIYDVDGEGGLDPSRDPLGTRDSAATGERDAITTVPGAIVMAK
jgi:hypothetical protein